MHEPASNPTAIAEDHEDPLEMFKALAREIPDRDAALAVLRRFARPHMVAGVLSMLSGKPEGGFLSACKSREVSRALFTADDNNRPLILIYMIALSD